MMLEIAFIAFLAILIADPNNIVDHGLRLWEWR